METTPDSIKIAITKKFGFEACHQLVGYPGPCGRLHGHSYKLNVTVTGERDSKTGMVMDYAQLKQIVNDNILQYVDHENLNEVMPLYFSVTGPTTCENMLVGFWYALDHELAAYGVQLTKIVLYETETNYGELTRDMVYRG
jgi:6-pyruvoyltetrahydropterin/6-carboxytetrahydropterin synthase